MISSRGSEPYPSGKGSDCKSAMHQFESDRLLLENTPLKGVFFVYQLHDNR